MFWFLLFCFFAAIVLFKYYYYLNVMYPFQLFKAALHITDHKVYISCIFNFSTIALLLSFIIILHCTYKNKYVVCRLSWMDVLYIFRWLSLDQIGSHYSPIYLFKAFKYENIYIHYVLYATSRKKENIPVNPFIKLKLHLINNILLGSPL